MRTVKILHAADLHLDSPFEGLSAEKAALRRAEQRQLLGSICELAASRGADVLLLSGDLLDSSAAYLETGEAIKRALGAAPMPVFIAPGNHDWYSGGSPWARLGLPENVHVFRSSEMECVSLPEIGARIWGAAFTDRYAAAPLRGFRAGKMANMVDIMCIHGEVGAPGSQYAPISEAELAESGMDYVALGHVHSFSGLRRAGNTAYAWPGCPEGRGFDETGEKGVIFAEVSSGGCELEFIPLDGRRYVIKQVDITGEADVLAAVCASLPERAGRDVCRVILTGECAVPPDVAALRRALEGGFFQLQLRERTTILRDVWEKCGEDTLRGLFLSELRRQYDAAETDGERGRITRAARWGVRAFDNGEEL